MDRPATRQAIQNLILSGASTAVPEGTMLLGKLIWRISGVIKRCGMGTEARWRRFVAAAHFPCRG